VVEAGVEHQLCDGCAVEFGWSCGAGGQSLTAVGTAQEPIIYTSANPTPTPGIWEGVDLFCGLSNGVTIDYWQVNWGGLFDQGALNIEATPPAPAVFSVTNSSFSNSAGYGIFVGFDETPMLMNNTFSNNAQGDTNP
jgi:parallel beta-helix repeat protein